MPRRSRKRMLGKRPAIEQERRADQLQDLARELHQQQRRRSDTDFDAPAHTAYGSEQAASAE